MLRPIDWEPVIAYLVMQNERWYVQEPHTAVSSILFVPHKTCQIHSVFILMFLLTSFPLNTALFTRPSDQS